MCVELSQIVVGEQRGVAVPAPQSALFATRDEGEEAEEEGEEEEKEEEVCHRVCVCAFV